MKKDIKSIVIIVLSIIIALLIAYIVYDKIIKTTNSNLETKCNVQESEEIAESNNTDDDEDKNDENKNNSNKNDDDEKDLEFFKEYLYYFMPQQNAGNFLRTIKSFSDEDISTYILFYYINQVNSGKLKPDKKDGSTYTTTKEEIDKVIYKYFGKKNVKFENSKGRTGIRKLSTGKYQVYWIATGWYPPEIILTGVSLDDSSNKNYYTVSGSVVNLSTKEINDIEFTILNENNNYFVKSIEYIESEEDIDE